MLPYCPNVISELSLASVNKTCRFRVAPRGAELYFISVNNVFKDFYLNIKALNASRFFLYFKDNQNPECFLNVLSAHTHVTHCNMIDLNYYYYVIKTETICYYINVMYVRLQDCM